MNRTGSVWLKLSNGNYPLLVSFNPTLNDPMLGGVYIIWQSGNPNRVIKVGQTVHLDLSIYQHSKDPKIKGYENPFQPLHFTWAILPQQYWNGVERYLGAHYRPLMDDDFIDVQPIEVDLPL